jgi:predicted molibdopterin-dependent oxidoreductase YjgC
VARRLGEIKAASGPDSIGVLTSARIPRELHRPEVHPAVLKTNSIDHCARL